MSPDLKHFLKSQVSVNNSLNCVLNLTSHVSTNHIADHIVNTRSSALLNDCGRNSVRVHVPPVRLHIVSDTATATKTDVKAKQSHNM